MRQPPPVSVRCSGGRPWQVLNPGLAALAAASLAAWIAGHADASVATTLLAAAVAGGLAARAASRSLPSPVELAWDGQAWTAGGARGTPGTLDIAVDAGPWMLLRLHPAAGGRTRWLPVSAAEAGAAWHALRVAAFATAGREGDALAAAATGARPPGR